MPKAAQRTVEERPGKMPAVVPQASAQTAFHRCEVMSMAINILRHTCQIVLEFPSENKPCINVKGKENQADPHFVGGSSEFAFSVCDEHRLSSASSPISSLTFI